MKGAVATLKSTIELGELLPLIPLQSVHGRTDMRIAGVAIDSREVRPSFLFVAVEGATTDGHCYLEDAAALGAVGVRGPGTSPGRALGFRPQLRARQQGY